MNLKKLNVGLVSNSTVKNIYINKEDLRRLESFANFSWVEFNEQSSWDESPQTSESNIQKLVKFSKNLDAIIICHGSPKIDYQIIKECNNLKFIGELEGDRFAQRIDLDDAFSNNIIVVDTTHGSSYPVAEWALGMILIALRNAGGHFRKLSRKIEWGSEFQRETEKLFLWNEELSGKTVGMIGAGYIARRLCELLKPFNVKIYAHDPYIPPEIASSLDFTLTSLDKVLSTTDVIVCLAPLTPTTKGLIAKKQLELIRSGSVFVNVSRGAIVDSNALINRLKKNDIVASLDVFDPEPIPVDSEIRTLENVFLSPHIAGTTLKSRERFFTEMVDELWRFFEGHQTLHSFNERTIANRKGL